MILSLAILRISSHDSLKVWIFLEFRISLYSYLYFVSALESIYSPRSHLLDDHPILSGSGLLV